MKKILATLILSLLSSPVLAQEPIKIGEMFAYSAIPDAGVKWQQGWKLALDEVNAAGGVLGKPLEILSRDDKASPTEAIKILEEYKARENIKIFFGTAHGHVGLAASAFAKQNRMLIFRGYGGTSDFSSTAGHDLYLTMQTLSDVWAGLLADKAVESGKKRWAFVAADYSTSRSVIEDFQRNMKRLAPDVEFVETQFFPIGKLDAGAVTQAVAHAKPDGIFVVMWGGDYLRFVRDGKKRNLFEKRLVMGPYAGYDSYIRPLGKEAPEGWYSGDGYPLNTLTDKKHTAFLSSFRSKYKEDPDLSSLYAYNVVHVLAETINAVGSDDPDKVVEAIKANKHEVAGATLSFRADGVSNLGDWAGYTGFVNGVPTILNPTYFPPDKYMPTAAENMSKWAK